MRLRWLLQQDVLLLRRRDGRRALEVQGERPISDSEPIVDGVLYFATLKRRTYGLDARTGRQLWAFPDGKYSPVVADKKRLYVVSYARMYGMVPR